MAYKIVGEGGGSGGNGADKEREELQELARAIVDAAKQGAWTAAQAVEQPRQENAPPRLPWPVFRSLKQDSFTRGGGSRGGGASRGNGGWSLPDTPEERRIREIQREMEDKARKRQEYERRRAEEERRRRAASPEPAFQGFTPGGGSRGGGASRGNDPWGQAEQSPFIRGGISGGGGARRGGSPWEQVAYPPDGAGSGGPEQELTEEASPEREEEAEQEEKSVSLPPVRQLLAKIAGAAGAGIAGAAGAVNAGIQAVGAAGRIAETFLRPKGVSDWDWSWRESAAQDAKNDLEKSAALYNVGQAKLDAAQRISEELNRKVVFDGTLPVDKTGIIDPETGTIRLNARVGGPENLRDNAVQLLEEQSKTVLDSSGSPGYNAGESELWKAEDHVKVDIPKNAQESYRNYDKYGWKGNAPGQTSGTAAGGKYRNRDGKLPTTDAQGNSITYQEWDVNNKQPGKSRDGERFVTGSDGSVYYTNNHYGENGGSTESIPFIKIR